MTDTPTFEQFVQQERTKLNKQRQELLKKRDGIDEQIATVDRELNAVEAYEAAKQGKLSVNRSGGARRSGVRQDVLGEIKKHPNGINRADLLESMGAKGDKSFEQSITNALSALKKQNEIDNKDGTYKAA